MSILDRALCPFTSSKHGTVLRLLATVPADLEELIREIEEQNKEEASKAKND